MPIYMYECPECGHPFERKLSVSQCGENQECPHCGASAKQVVAPTSFVLKGDGWPGKDIRVKSQMYQRRKVVGRKQRDHVAPSSKLQPNVDGERTGSWTEAKELAERKGKDASSYAALAAQE